MLFKGEILLGHDKKTDKVFIYNSNANGFETFLSKEPIYTTKVYTNFFEAYNDFLGDDVIDLYYDVQFNNPNRYDHITSVKGKVSDLDKNVWDPKDAYELVYDHIMLKYNVSYDDDITIYIDDDTDTLIKNGEWEYDLNVIINDYMEMLEEELQKNE